MAMSKELEQTFNACLRCANIEAIRERDMDNGGYGCVISPGSGADMVLNNVRAEGFLKKLAARYGKDLRQLARLRGLANGNVRKRVDFYNISPRLLFLPLRYRRAVNSHHTTRLYANVMRLVDVTSDAEGRTLLRFLSGRTLPVKVSYEFARSRLQEGRGWLYHEYYYCQQTLRSMQVTLGRLEKLAEEW